MKSIFNLLAERREFFISLTIEHIKIALISILIAMVLGLFIGIFIAKYEKSSKIALSIINFVYTIPSISLLGFLIPLSGIGNTTAVIALSIYALLPMVRNTYTGITNVEPELIEAAKGMGSTQKQILFRIKLPLAAPVIMSAIRNMATMTIALTGIASFIGAGGLGVAIYRGITTNNTTLTVCGSLLIAVLALVVDFLLGIVQRITDPYQKKSKASKGALIIAAAALLILVISIVGGKKESINIATKPMTEQFILGEMLKELIEEKTDLKVELTAGVGGGTSNIFPGMEKGDFDLYPEYTGTAWNMILKREDFYTEDKFPDLKGNFDKNYNMKWLGKYGFNNTYGIAVLKSTKEKYNLNKISDLKNFENELIFGANYDFFERADGYKGLSEKYGLNFKSTLDMDIGLKYEALKSKQVDVIVVFTTDGKLSDENISMLDDDLGFFPSYYCSTIIRDEILEKHPEIADIIGLLDGKIDDEIMQKLNYEVEENERQAKDVAHEFLVEEKIK